MNPKTILVVDDEKPIREFLLRVFSREGYHLLEASNGHEALDIFKRQSQDIHLVLMDISMPQMDGPTCAKLMLKEKPLTPVLYMSGDMDPATMPAELTNPSMDFLAKPFTVQDILSKARGLLGPLSKD